MLRTPMSVEGRRPRWNMDVVPAHLSGARQNARSMPTILSPCIRCYPVEMLRTCRLDRDEVRIAEERVVRLTEEATIR